MKRLIYFIASLALPVAVLGACNPEFPGQDDKELGPTGSVVVGLSITGQQIDRDGCGVRLDDARCGRLQAGEELILSRVPTGLHTLTLHGLEANCNVTGGTARSVQVFEDQTEFVQYNANCGPAAKREICNDVGQATGRCGDES